jgi:4-amino-4-deoxy-L-arabinose transferase-like glycosyltransferase
LAEKNSGQQPTANGQLFCFYLLLALGLLAKGPPLFVHLVIGIGAFHLCYRQRMPGQWWSHLCGIALVLLIAAPWAAYVYTHIPHVIELWRYESIGELSDNTGNARAWWFYFPQLFLLALPWMSLWILGIVRPFLRSAASGQRRNFRPFFPLVWYVLTIIFFSFVNLKKNAYLLPVMPAQALLMAQGTMLLALWLKRRPRERLPRVLVMAQTWVGVGFALWLGWVLLFSAFRQPIPIGIALFLVALLAAIYPLWVAAGMDNSSSHFPSFTYWLAAQAAGYALLLSLFFNFYDAPKNNIDSARPFINAIAPRLLRPGCTLARARMDPAVAFYLPDGVAPFEPNAACAQVILERSPAAPDPKVSDFDYLRLDSPVVEIQSLRLPRFSRWRLYVLMTRATGPASVPTGPQ